PFGSSASLSVLRNGSELREGDHPRGIDFYKWHTGRSAIAPPLIECHQRRLEVLPSKPAVSEPCSQLWFDLIVESYASLLIQATDQIRSKKTFSLRSTSTRFQWKCFFSPSAN